MTKQSGPIFAVILLSGILFGPAGLVRHVTAATMSKHPGSSKLQKASQKQPKAAALMKREIQTQIKSVTPSKVKLAPGTKGKTITVKGLALTQITGVKLLQKNQSVQGVRASLKGGVKADSFKVSLFIAQDAKPGDYQLQLLARKKTINISSSKFTAQVTGPKKAIVSVAGKKGLKAGLNGALVRVKSARPDKAHLIGGAIASTTVTLKGSNLNQVTSVQVLRSNSPVASVKASLLKGRNGGSRLIKLNALESASPGNYRLRLLVNGGPPVTLSTTLLSIRVTPSFLAQVEMKNEAVAQVQVAKVGQLKGKQKLNIASHQKRIGRLIKPISQDYKMLPTDDDLLVTGELVDPTVVLDRPPSGFAQFPPKGRVTYYLKGNGDGQECRKKIFF